MEDEPAELPKSELHPSAPPTIITSSPARGSRLLHTRVYSGVLVGLTIIVAQPADISDLAARQLGHYSTDGSYHLTLPESFLLSSLSTLAMVPPLQLCALLEYCCRHIARFPALLLTYFTCTARGWVVREGSKLGVDFLLYRQTAGGGGGSGNGGSKQKSRQHSVYAVRVIEQQQQSARDGEDRRTGSSTTSLQQWNALLRVAQSTKKRLLLSTVSIPVGVHWEGESALAALALCRVEQCELSRWSPAVHVG